MRSAFQLCWRPEDAARSESRWSGIDVRKEAINGKYFEADSGELVEARSSDESYDQKAAKQLWKVSEELVGQRFDYEIGDRDQGTVQWEKIRR